MRFIPAPNIWAMEPTEINRLQPGQWVYAGDKDSKGRFLGIRPSGSVVVAWHENARAHPPYQDYIRTLREYATGN